MSKKFFTDFTPIQLETCRKNVRDMYAEIDLKGEPSDVQQIADLLQFSRDEVIWLLNN